MSRIETLGHALEGLTADLQALVPHGLPGLGLGDDSLANLPQGIGFRMPQATSGEAGPRFQMQVKARPVDAIFAAPTVREMGRQVGLVGALVLGEASVAVDAEHRTARGPGIRYKVFADAR